MPGGPAAHAALGQCGDDLIGGEASSLHVKDEDVGDDF